MGGYRNGVSKKAEKVPSVPAQEGRSKQVRRTYESSRRLDESSKGTEQARKPFWGKKKRGQKKKED